MAPSDINRVACPPGRLKSTANGSTNPVVAFTQWIKEACSHHNALIGASVEDFGSFAAALDGCHPQMLSIDFEDDDDDSAPSSHPPLSPYHTGRLSCVFRGENVSGLTLMTTREFWTPSLSKPPSAHFICRGCCVSSGGEYKPLTTIILSDSGLDHFRLKMHHTMVCRHTRPCCCPGHRHQPPAPNPLYDEAFPSLPQPTLGGTSTPTPTPPTLSAQANNLPHLEISSRYLLRCHCLLPPSYPSHSRVQILQTQGGDSFNPSTTVSYSIRHGSIYDKSSALVMFVSVMALGPPIHRSLIIDANIGHKPPTNPLGSSRGGVGKLFLVVLGSISPNSGYLGRSFCHPLLAFQLMVRWCMVVTFASFA